MLTSSDVPETRLARLLARFIDMPAGPARSAIHREIEIARGQWDGFFAQRAEKALAAIPTVRIAVDRERKRTGARGPIPLPGKRAKNGRLSRKKEHDKARRNTEYDKAEWDTMSAAVLARRRLYDLPYPQSKDQGAKQHGHLLDQLAGSVIGRMVLAGELTVAQGDAAFRYLDDVDSYRAAISAPPQPGAVDLNADHGLSVKAENVASKLRAIARYCGEKGPDGVSRGGARGAIQNANNRHRGSNLFAAIDYFVLRDERHPHMIGDLMLALDALVVWYGLAEGS